MISFKRRIIMVQTNDSYKRTTISLRHEEYEVLRFLAFKRKISVAGLVRELIQELLEDEEDIRDGLKALEDKGNTLDWETFKRQYLGVQS
jgi:DNA-binding MarR family transcriptional regulator